MEKAGSGLGRSTGQDVGKREFKQGSVLMKDFRFNRLFSMGLRGQFTTLHPNSSKFL